MLQCPFESFFKTNIWNDVEWWVYFPYFGILGINFLAHDFDFKKATVVLALGVRHSIPTIAKEKIEDAE